MPDESHSEQLRRGESDELLATAAKLIEHAETLKAQAAELKKQVIAVGPQHPQVPRKVGSLVFCRFDGIIVDMKAKRRPETIAQEEDRSEEGRI